MTRHEDYDRLSRMVQLSSSADEVWAEIGDFGRISEWHPMIKKSEQVEIEGEPYRHLETVDGELILERLVETGPHHYAYEIVDSRLPVDGYRALFSCVPEGTGCHVYWSAHFEATDPSADEIVAAIYEEGLRAIRERFDQGRRGEDAGRS